MTTHASHFRPGQKYKNFEVLRSFHISELQSTLIELVHEPSGAKIMHIANDDPENLFCLSFQTLPYNSNGVAHILEHTVLCGSKKFPVKDPFFSMNRRSLNTFMNALTGADFTCYPAASQVSKDFYNLLEVYLDAVFQPLLNEFSFLQEGHRLEFSKPNDPNSPLEIKGIVYNEMKGALSSASARLSEAINATLFSNITYGCNSGGEPKEIPTLTYQELKNFYHTYYHPSRCLFFFYGNMPLEHHLDFIAEQTLNHITKAPPLPPIPLQQRFHLPVYRDLTYPIGPQEDLKDKTLIAFGWLTCHILEQQDALALNILEIILMDTDASPLKMALLKSGLCKQAHSFIDVELNEIPWGLTLKGCQPESAEPLERIIKDTLQTIAINGIPLHLIENAIHQLEFHRSEITGDHAPFGLSLFMRSGLLKQHGADPIEGLTIHSLFDRLHQATLENPKYFSDIIQKYLIDNPHFIRIIMRPDPELGEKEIHTEKKELEKIKKSLTTKEKEALIKRTNALSAFQKKQEEQDTEILPKVSLNDIPLSAHDYPLIQEKIEGAAIFHHNVFTNDIVYADVVYNLPYLSEEDLPYLRLFTVILTQVGADQRNYRDHLDYVQGNTGGINAGISLNLNAHDSHQFSPTFHLRGKALHRKASKLFPLMRNILSRPTLDDDQRLKEIIVKHYTGLESRLNQSALKYAINLSASCLNQASRLANDLYGLSYYWKIQGIVNHYENEKEHVKAKLKEIADKVLCLEDPHLVLSCNAGMYDQLKAHSFYGLFDIEKKPCQPWQQQLQLFQVPPQGRMIASPVAFIGKVFPTVSYTHPDAPALNIASFLFDNLSLHTKIREQGGAYGGGAVSNPMSGNFYFYSYRDPNIVQTLKAFEIAVAEIVNGEFDDMSLEEAKFEMIQGLDSPVSPGSQAEIAYGWLREGRTYDMRQKFRNDLLNLKKEQVIEAVKRQIVPNSQKGSPVVFAGKDLLEKANAELKADGKKELLLESV